MEFEYDTKNVLHVRIDRKRKFLGTVFLRALGLYNVDDIIRTFYDVRRVAIDETTVESMATAEQELSLIHI